MYHFTLFHYSLQVEFKFILIMMSWLILVECRGDHDLSEEVDIIGKRSADHIVSGNTVFYRYSPTRVVKSLLNNDMVTEKELSISLPNGFAFCGGARDNLCQTGEVITFYHVAKDTAVPSPMVSINYMRECKNGQFFGLDCTCGLKVSDCYHWAEGCLIHKLRDLPTGTCEAPNWKMYEPKVCSFGTPSSACMPIPRQMEVDIVLDRTGIKHYLRDVTIVYMQEDQENDYLYDKAVKDFTKVIGDAHYCRRKEPRMPSCFRPTSGQNDTQLRVFKRSSEIPYIQVGSCLEPIYCHRREIIDVYDNLNDDKHLTVTGTCGKNHVVIQTDSPKAKHVEICGSEFCETVIIKTKSHTFKRPFMSRILDKILSYTIKTDATNPITGMIDCQLYEVCDAIDCTLCKESWYNPSCWGLLNYVLLTIIICLALPIVFTLMSITSYLLCILGKAFSFNKRAICYFTQPMYKKVKDKVMEVKNAVYEANEELPLFERRQQPIRRIVGTRIVALTILCILPMVDGELCMNSSVLQYVSDSCIQKDGKWVCEEEFDAKIALHGFNLSSCVVLEDSDKNIMGLVSLTTEDLYYTCQKKSKFYTYRSMLKTNTIMRCPNAGDCSAEWCAKVDDSTNITGLQETNSPNHKSCIQGEACWAMSCFYCTSSCHISLFYAQPEDHNFHEIFECLSWELTARIVIRNSPKIGSSESLTLNLVPGEKKTIFGVSVELTYNLDSPLPGLDKDFISDGSHTALIEKSQEGVYNPGSVSMLQCKKQAISSCKLAPDACLCLPSGGGDICKCKNFLLENAYTMDKVFPLWIGRFKLLHDTTAPKLKPPVMGKAIVTIEGKFRIAGVRKPKETCTFKILQLSGCYECRGGAKVSYSCIIGLPVEFLVKCTNNINFMVLCKPGDQVSQVNLHMDSPIINTACTIPCQREDSSMVGTLTYVPLIDEEQGKIITMIDDVQHESVSGWFSRIWNNWEFRLTTWILTILVGIIFCIILLKVIFRLLFKNKKE